MSIAVQPATTPATPPPVAVMTEEEFLEKYGGETSTELVDGVVVRYPMPGTKHGRSCTKLSTRLDVFTEEHKLGQVCSNDTFVRIRTNPPRIRGADVLYLSYARWPADAELPDGVCPVSPDLVGEVKSPSDTWPEVVVKVNDYLSAGVLVVLVLDPPSRSVTAYRSGATPQVFGAETLLTIPDVLPASASPSLRSSNNSATPP